MGDDTDIAAQCLRLAASHRRDGEPRTAYVLTLAAAEITRLRSLIPSVPAGDPVPTADQGEEPCN